MVGEIAEAQDSEVQETIESQDTEDHETTAALDTVDQETTEAQDSEVYEMIEAQDTEDHVMIETLDIAVQKTTEAQDTIKVHLDSKETELQFTVEPILKQQDINQIMTNLTEKILGIIILIHFILLLGPNYLQYYEKKNVSIVDLMMSEL